MTAKKESMSIAFTLQFSRDFFRERRNVLSVFEDGNPLAMFMGANAFKALQHFIALDRDSALGPESFGKKRAPHGMGVQDATGISCARHRQVQKSFRGRFSGACKYDALAVNFEEVSLGQRGLV